MSLSFKKITPVISLFNRQYAQQTFIGEQMVVRYQNTDIVNENIGFTAIRMIFSKSS